MPHPTLLRDLSTLQALRSGERAWLWMTDGGPARSPTLVVVPEHRDPRGERFMAAVITAMQGTHGGRSVQGQVRRSAAGRLVVSVHASVDRAEAITAALSAEAGGLEEVLLVQLSETGSVVTTRRVSRPVRTARRTRRTASLPGCRRRDGFVLRPAARY